MASEYDWSEFCKDGIGKRPYYHDKTIIERNGKYFDVCIIFYPVDIIYQPEISYSFKVLFENMVIYEKDFKNYLEYAENYKKNFIDNLDILISTEFKNTKLANYISGEIFKTEDAIEYYDEIEFDSEGNCRFVMKSRIIKVEPK
jgi:hypothetical protein